MFPARLNWETFASSTTFPKYCFVVKPGLKGAFLLKKIQDKILNPKESGNGFCVSLLNRSIQNLSDRGVSKEPKNPLPEWILRFL